MSKVDLWRNFSLTPNIKDELLSNYNKGDKGLVGLGFIRDAYNPKDRENWSWTEFKIFGLSTAKITDYKLINRIGNYIWRSTEHIKVWKSLNRQDEFVETRFVVNYDIENREYNVFGGYFLNNKNIQNNICNKFILDNCKYKFSIPDSVRNVYHSEVLYI